MNQAAITALIAAIEAGEKMATVIAAREIFGLHERRNLLKAADGSLDAAKALHEALLPRWTWGRCEKGNMWVMRGLTDLHYHNSDNPARDLLIVILKAYQAQTAGNAP